MTADVADEAAMVAERQQGVAEGAFRRQEQLLERLKHAARG